MIISCNLMHLLSPPQSPKDTGLGNTLFQIATMYALSKDYDFTMNFYELVRYCNLLNKFNYDHDKKIFKKIIETYDVSSQNNSYITLKEGEKSHIEQFVDHNFIFEFKQNLNSNIKLKGYFQSHLYFDKYRNDIQNLFQMDNDSEQFIKNNYSILFDSNKTCISIHIRMNYGKINYNFKYFEETISFFQEKFSNIHFLIFSNCIDKVKDWFQGKQDFTIVTGNIDYIDLWIMSLCKHNIISHSTFAWWGAYLNNNPEKIVTFPKDTLRICCANLYPHVVHGQRITEYYMPNWIGFDTLTLYN